MSVIFKAALYCDTCGMRHARKLQEAGVYDTGDSGDFPQGPYPEGAADSPQHCANEDQCDNAVDLQDYGFGVAQMLHGAETRKVGAILSEELTDYGVSYLLEMLARPPRNAYQRALHDLYRETFAHYIPSPPDPEDAMQDALDALYAALNLEGAAKYGAEMVAEANPTHIPLDVPHHYRRIRQAIAALQALGLEPS